MANHFLFVCVTSNFLDYERTERCIGMAYHCMGYAVLDSRVYQ